MGMDRLFSVFRISSSGMTAQRKLMDATASNIANAETTETENGGPYVPKRVRFSEAGVRSLFGRTLENEMSRPTVRFISREKGLVPDAGVRSRLSGSGVNAVETVDRETPMQRVYDPESPDADEDGYVEKPNVNIVKEMTNMIVASRSYEANVTVMNAAKNMMKKALDI